MIKEYQLTTKLLYTFGCVVYLCDRIETVLFQWHIYREISI